jgi:hypothetical protein
MSIKASTGLRNKILDTAPVRGLLNLGFIKLFGGTPPVSADDAATGVLLCTISNAGSATGLTFAASAVAGAIQKTSTEIWSGTNVAAGTCTHYRFVSSADTGVSSTTEPRLQGTVAVAGADLVLTNPALVNGAVQTVDYYNLALPTV